MDRGSVGPSVSSQKEKTGSHDDMKDDLARREMNAWVKGIAGCGMVQGRSCPWLLAAEERD